MDEPVRWVSKVEAAQELEVSLSTLDRMIRRGEIEVVKEGRRVYVRTHGPEYLSDDELLRRAITREDELERTVRELERRSSELERERDEARASASVSRDAYEEVTEAYRKEQAGRGRRRAGRAAGHQRSRDVASADVGAWRIARSTIGDFLSYV